MKKLLVAGVAAAAVVSAPALAADMSNWSGLYVGGNIGAMFARASGTSDFTDTTPAFSSNPQTNSFSKTGFLGGGQVGINWQFNPAWVAGMEADWDWTGKRYSFCRQTDSTSAPCSDSSDGFETISSKTDWLATARARLGVTAGNWLFYGTGGAALGRINTSLTLNCLVNGCGANSTVALAATSTTSTVKVGWAAGLGAEVMLGGQWSARAEWLHVDLGTVSNMLPTVGSVGTVQTAVWSRVERFDEFRVGLNYRFGGM
jgi:outer membrane immunogenic protein